MEKRWTIESEPDLAICEQLMKSLNVSSTIARLLYRRGIRDYDDAKAFFRPGDLNLHDPFLMLNMQAAVDRVAKAINHGERIMVFGDYDVDGTCAVSLVYSFLSKFTSEIEYYIPDRYAEGYGLSKKGIDTAQSNACGLMIILDCGIKAVDLANYASTLKIDLIICDHHLPGDSLPKAIILNPKQKDCSYPYKELTGCGVGFKLIQAFNHDQGNSAEACGELLDLVTLSIGADIVPITGENRSIASLGLNLIRRQPRPALYAILAPTKRLHNCTISDLVFQVAPRINAAGRMESGNMAVELLSCSDSEKASKLANEIDALNKRRKETEKIVTEQALEITKDLRKNGFRHSNVVYHSDWHKGVIGIVASRIIESYYAPTVVITDSGDQAAGSVRSVKGFNVYEALEACSEHLIQFGGHKYAAGLTIEKDQIDNFRLAFEKVVKSSISERSLTPEIKIEEEIDLGEIGMKTADELPKFFRILEQFAPFGPGNMKPSFLSRKLIAKNVKVLGESHLKFEVGDKDGNSISCIAFGMAEKQSILDGEIDIVYAIEKNVWQGNVSLQLNIKDFCSSGALKIHHA